MGSEIDVTERRNLKHKQCYSRDFSTFCVATVLNNNGRSVCVRLSTTVHLLALLSSGNICETLFIKQHLPTQLETSS
jgi:hypothetical protein